MTRVRVGVSHSAVTWGEEGERRRRLSNMETPTPVMLFNISFIFQNDPLHVMFNVIQTLRPLFKMQIHS